MPQVTLVFLSVSMIFIPIGVVCLIYGMRVRSHPCVMGDPGGGPSLLMSMQACMLLLCPHVCLT